jgi:hypothetical protein
LVTPYGKGTTLLHGLWNSGRLLVQRYIDFLVVRMRLSVSA